MTADDPPRVKLTDFGCAGGWGGAASGKRRLGRFRTFAGTPAYMSPQVSEWVKSSVMGPYMSGSHMSERVGRIYE